MLEMSQAARPLDECKASLYRRETACSCFCEIELEKSEGVTTLHPRKVSRVYPVTRRQAGGGALTIKRLDNNIGEHAIVLTWRRNA